MDMEAGAGIKVSAYDLPAVVDPLDCGRAWRGVGGVHRDIPAAAQYEAMQRIVGIDVRSHNLPRSVDPGRIGALEEASAAMGVVDSGENAVAEQKAVICQVGINIFSHNLLAVVNSKGESAVDATGGVDRCEMAVAQQIAVTDVVGVEVVTDDLRLGVYAFCFRKSAGRVGLVDRR